MATILAIPDRIVEGAAPLPLGRLLRAYAIEAKYETLNALRTPAFAIPFIVIPVAIYFLFGIVIAGGEEAQARSEWGPGIANYLFTGFSVLAVIMPGIFSGVGLALERDGNLLKLKRALPTPAGAILAAKVLTSMCVTAIALALVLAVALIADKITLSGLQVAVIYSVLIVGCIPFCAIGFFIGSIASGSAAPAYGNLVFLPMMWLSGLFIPLPDALERFVVIWPAFHLNQLALGLAGVSQFAFLPPSVPAGVLVGVTVLFGGLAIRRLARVG
jgi:ABC-2 type transport system permease protein